MLEATAPVATSLVSSVAAHQKAQSVGATVRQWQCVRATLASRELSHLNISNHYQSPSTDLVRSQVAREISPGWLVETR